MSIKKRLLAVLLTVLMVAAFVPATAVSAAEVQEIQLGTFGVNGWENWIGGTYAPSSELLISFTGEESQTAFADIKNHLNLSGSKVTGGEYSFRLMFKNLADESETKTINILPSTVYDYGTTKFLRFEPVEAEGDNQFIPKQGAKYSVDMTVFDSQHAEKYHGEVASTNCVMYPMQNGHPVRDAEPNYPISITAYSYGSKYFEDQTINEEKVSCLLMVLHGDQLQGHDSVALRDGNVAVGNVTASTRYYYKFEITGNDGSTMSLDNVSAYNYYAYTGNNPDSNLIARIPLVKSGFTPEDGVTYSLKGEIWDKGLNTATSDDVKMYEFAFNGVTNGKTAVPKGEDLEGGKLTASALTVYEEDILDTLTLEFSEPIGANVDDVWNVHVNGVPMKCKVSAVDGNKVTLSFPAVCELAVGETYNFTVEITSGTFQNKKVAVTVTAAEPKVPLPIIPGNGDANGDGYISIKDVSLILAYLADKDMEKALDMAAADTNGNGEVEIADITCLFTFDNFAAARNTGSAEEFEGETKDFSFYSPAKAEAWGTPLYWQCNVQLPKTEGDFTANEGKENYAYRWYVHIREKDSGKPWMTSEAEITSHGSLSSGAVAIYRLQLGTFTAQLKVGTTYEVVVQVVDKASGDVIAKSGALELQWTQEYVDQFNKWLTADNAYVPTIPPTDGHPKAAH